MSSRIKLVGLGLLTVAVGALGGMAVSTPVVAGPPSTASSSDVKFETLGTEEASGNLERDTRQDGRGVSKDVFVLEKKPEIEDGQGSYYLIDPDTKKLLDDGWFLGEYVKFSSVSSFEEAVIIDPRRDFEVYYGNPREHDEAAKSVAWHTPAKTFKVQGLNLDWIQTVSGRYMPVLKPNHYPEAKNLTYRLYDPIEREWARTGFMVDGEERNLKLDSADSGLLFVPKEWEPRLELRYHVTGKTESGTLLGSAELLEQLPSS